MTDDYSHLPSHANLLVGLEFAQVFYRDRLYLGKEVSERLASEAKVRPVKGWVGKV
jgi:hypothetical protein